MSDEKTGTDAGTKTTGTGGTTEATESTSGGQRRMPAMSFDVARARTAVARVVWLICALFALILAAAALLGALDANTGNELVKFIGDTADKVDLGFFDLDNPIKDFDTKVDGIEDTKTTLFNYGIAAIVWLVIGRVADRVIRP